MGNASSMIYTVNNNPLQDHKFYYNSSYDNTLLDAFSVMSDDGKIDMIDATANHLLKSWNYELQLFLSSLQNIDMDKRVKDRLIDNTKIVYENRNKEISESSVIVDGFKNIRDKISAVEKEIADFYNNESQRDKLEYKANQFKKKGDYESYLFLKMLLEQEHDVSLRDKTKSLLKETISYRKENTC
nr:CPPV316 putative A47L-like protein [Cooks petrelpox virus]